VALGELKRSPRPLAAIWGLLLREGSGKRWREGEGKGGEKREREGDLNPLTHVWLRD